MMKIFLAGSAITLVLVLGVSWGLVQLDLRARSDEQFAALSAAGHSINSRFFTIHRAELEWFARQDEVKNFLVKGGSAPPALTRIFSMVQGLLALDNVHIVSKDGVVVAASRPEYLGTDLSGKKNVRAGLAGKPMYDIGIGEVSKARGIYASVPVWFHGKTIGVATFRTDAVQLDQTLDHFPQTFLLDPHGKIFSYSQHRADLASSEWHWDGTSRVQLNGRWYRTSLYPLDAVPGYTLVSVLPETFPWEQLLIVDSLLVLVVAMVISIRHQFRLVKERRTEADVRRHRDTLLANLLEGIAVLDREGKLVWANPAFERLAQMAPGTSAPTWGDLWDRPTLGPWQDIVEGRQKEVVFESVLKGRQGGWTPVLAGFTQAGGQFLLSVLDRSERHRSDQLLRQSQKLTVLGQLAGGVAHDLNNMLGVLMGMTDLLKMTLPEQDPLQESVDLMLTTLARAANLSDKMLNFARQTPLVKEPLDVTALLRELRFLARTALPEKIDAVVEVNEEPCEVMGDENLLLSALLNLILNAGEAMDGAGTVLVKGVRTDLAQFTVTVTDQGRGMDKETLARIFEPFFSTKHDQGGTGLGLSLVRRTILEHDGTIRITSEPGKGTCVTVVLPVVGA